jgi:uncharacterized RDD family membrane protein YckC
MTRIINRLASMFLDHIVMCFIVVPALIITFVLLQLILGDNLYSDYIGGSYRNGVMIFMMILCIYFLKDSFRGKSVAKRMIGLQVVNRKTSEPASSFLCFIRNLLLPIWPLEVLISIFSPSRRLGDLIANTKVVPSEKENLKTIILDIKQKKFSFNTILILMIAIGYSYAISYLLAFLMIY